MNCVKCGKLISGKYYSFKSLPEKYYCSECMSGKRCSVCSRPLGPSEIIELNKRAVCRICFESLKECSACKSKILGKYVTYDNGEIVCSSCFVSSKECSICGGYVKDKVQIKGRIICEKCRSLLPECDYHKGSIVGNGYRINGKNICLTCLESLPKCYYCGVPIKDEFVSIGLKRFCKDCSKIIEYCSICKEPLIGFFIDNHHGIKTCLNCEKIKNKCTLCGADCLENPKDLPDGRIYCTKCGKTEVSSEIKAMEIALSFLSFLETELNIDADPGDIDISITEIEKIELLRTNKSSPGSFACIESIPGGVCIFMPRLPEFFFIESLTKAITSYWLSNQIRPVFSTQLFEGFCELVTEEYLGQRDMNSSESNVMNIKSIFNEGYSYLKKIKDEKGLKGAYHHILSFVPEPEQNINDLLGNILE